MSAEPSTTFDDETPSASPAALPLFNEPVPDLPERGSTRETNPWTIAVGPLRDPSEQATSGGGARFGLRQRWDGFNRGPDVDWNLVDVLCGHVSERLSRAVAENRDLSRQDQEHLAHFHTVDLIDETMTQWANTGRPTLTPAQKADLARAVGDALFRLGRLQPLVDDDRVENININGYDDVELELTDGTVVKGPPVADSDQQLIDYLVFLASRSEVNARVFSEAQPVLHLRLDDGSRLAATAWISPRPQVTIRRHRLVRVTLEDLADLFEDPTAPTLLAAAVKARLSILVTGAPGAGKTTLLRALANEIPARERIATVESEYELHLHQFRDRTWAWEARDGTGEVGADGRRAGEYTMIQAVWDVVRFNVSRVLVGEVRGREIVPLIQVTENGTGTLATTHSRDATAAIRKLVTCAMQEGPQWDATLATAKLAESIDLVVHLELTGAVGDDGEPRRRVSEIVAVEPGDTLGTVATTHVYETNDEGRLVVGTLPDRLRALSRHGFDLGGYTARQESRAPHLGLV